MHPRRVLHGPAAPDWRGEIRVGRTRDVDAKIESGVRLGVSHVKVPGSPVILGWAGAPRQAAPTQGPCLRICSLGVAAARRRRHTAAARLALARRSRLLQGYYEGYYVGYYEATTRLLRGLLRGILR